MKVKMKKEELVEGRDVKIKIFPDSEIFLLISHATIYSPSSMSCIPATMTAIGKFEK